MSGEAAMFLMKTFRVSLEGRTWGLLSRPAKLGLSGGLAGGSRSGLLGEGTLSGSNTAVLSEGDVELAIIPLAGQEDDGKRQDRDGENIKDAEEDEGSHDTNLVAAVRQTPGDGVEEPEEVDQAGKGEIVTADTNTAGR